VLLVLGATQQWRLALPHHGLPPALLWGALAVGAEPALLAGAPVVPLWEGAVLKDQRQDGPSYIAPRGSEA